MYGKDRERTSAFWPDISRAWKSHTILTTAVTKAKPTELQITLLKELMSQGKLLSRKLEGQVGTEIHSLLRAEVPTWSQYCRIINFSGSR